MILNRTAGRTSFPKISQILEIEYLLWAQASAALVKNIVDRCPSKRSEVHPKSDGDLPVLGRAYVFYGLFRTRLAAQKSTFERANTIWYYGFMATRKMTFSLPEELATRLVKRVPARERSRFLAQVLEKSLREGDESLIRACLIANQDPDVKAIEEEWDEIRDAIEEPWNDPQAR